MNLKIATIAALLSIGFQASAALPPTLLEQLVGNYTCIIPNTTMKNEMSIEKKDAKIHLLNFSGRVDRVDSDGIGCAGYDLLNATRTEETDASGSTAKYTDICTATQISRQVEDKPAKTNDKLVNSLSVTKTNNGATIVSKITVRDPNGKIISLNPITFACTKHP